MKRKIEHLIWSELSFLRPLEFQTVVDTFTHFAGWSGQKSIVWEIRSKNNVIKHFVGAEEKDLRAVTKLFETHGKFIFSKPLTPKRNSLTFAKEMRLSSQNLSLKVKKNENFTRTMLATLADIDKNEELVVQLIIGRPSPPQPTPTNLVNPHATWWQVISGNIPPISAEANKQLTDKNSLATFNTVVRIGVKSASPKRHMELIKSLQNCFKILESSHVKIRFKEILPQKMDEAQVPWQFPLKLSTLELANLGIFPTGNEELAGFSRLHPKIILPPIGLKQNHKRIFGDSHTLNGAISAKNLGISEHDSLFHTVLLGGTGSGKSTAMLHLILADISLGRSVLVIDPKGDLVRDILERFPKNREEDLILLDPTSPNLVGFNPLELTKHGISPELLTQHLMAIFQDLFADNWGIRSADVLSHAILTLAKSQNATLAMLPQLLTNKPFLQKILKQIYDPFGVESFWNYYDNLSSGEQIQLISPVLNKLRQIFIHPNLRNMLGVAKPKFSLSDLFYERKIVLVSLNKGITGAESARFLGSLLVSLTWSLGLKRAEIPPEKRHRISLFIDELQDYLRLPTDLADALSQARGLGLSLTLAHQYRHQLSQNIKMAIDANCRNKICFGLDMNDAQELAHQAPELTSEDFYSLPQYHIYAKLHNNGNSTGWLSGKTFPAPFATRNYGDLVAKSALKYGTPVSEIEADFSEQFGFSDVHSPQNTNKNLDKHSDKMPKNIGRRKKNTAD